MAYDSPPSTDSATVLKPYAAPDATLLGSIAGLTAGDRSGTLDQLFGGDGGFQDPDPDPTS